MAEQTDYEGFYQDQWWPEEESWHDGYYVDGYGAEDEWWPDDWSGMEQQQAEAELEDNEETSKKLEEAQKAEQDKKPPVDTRRLDPLILLRDATKEQKRVTINQDYLNINGYKVHRSTRCAYRRAPGEPFLDIGSVWYMYHEASKEDGHYNKDIARRHGYQFLDLFARSELLSYLEGSTNACENIDVLYGRKRPKEEVTKNLPGPPRAKRPRVDAQPWGTQLRLMISSEELVEVPRPSVKIKPGGSFSSLDCPADTNALLERQHEELLERLASQDEMLQAILEVPRMAFPFEEVKKDQHVDFVSPVASRVHSSDQEDSVKKRLSKQSKQSKQSNSTPSPNRGAPPKTTFTPPLRSFSAFDMSLKNTADAADGDRSRRRYASLRFKSPNPENNTFIAQIVRHALFDLFFGLVVVTNSILIGVEVELSLESDKIPVGLQVTGFCYTVLLLGQAYLWIR
eukprot:s1913_g6.t1